MLADFFSIFFWWIFLFGLGIVFLPISWEIFHHFFDHGYAFSKIVGILIVSYIIWLLGSLKILPFQIGTIWLVIIIAIAFNYFHPKVRIANLKEIIIKNWKIFALEEGLFFTALIFWSFIRGFQPAIQGLEKFMDFGFVNAILRSQYFPPADMWLAGKTINYYYFGHLVTAVLTKLSGLDSAITYNLMIATIFGLSFATAFSLGANLVFLGQKKLSIVNYKLLILTGLLSAFLLTLGSNLHPLYWFLTHGNFKTYWYPDATRFIVQQFGAADNTIHEFPIYSFVVADLHGHLLDLPFVFLFLGFMLRTFKLKKLKFIDFILPSLLLAVMYMTSAWEFPIYLLVLGVIILWFNWLKYGLTTKTITKTLFFTLGPLFLALAFSLPFHLNFKSIAGGIALVDFHSPLWMLLVLWGFPLFITINFLLFLKKQKSIQVDYFILILLSISWLLIIMPEFIRIKDIYINNYQRANTMFKFTYQSFVMFSLAAGYIIVRVLTNLKKSFLKTLLVIFYLSFGIFIFLYHRYAILSYYGLKNYHEVYGLNYLKNLYPDDYQAIVWLNQNITGQPVILEAVGESYTDFGRVSANTGLPTILGWRVHEWLWRGSFDEPGARTEEVKKIYETKNPQEAKEILRKYRVEYIFVGKLENRAYPNLDEEKFSQIGEVVFRQGQTKIYKVN